MKKILLLLALLVPLASFGAANPKIIGAPFLPEEDKRFYDDESVQVTDESNISSNTAALAVLQEGAGVETAAGARKRAKAIYDVSVDGGSSIQHDLGVALPVGARLEAVTVYIDSGFANASGTSSIEIGCANTTDSNDLMKLVNPATYAANHWLKASIGAGDAASSGVFIGLAPTNNSVVNSIQTACDILLSVDSANGHKALTSGKLTVLVDYFMAP